MAEIDKSDGKIVLGERGYTVEWRHGFHGFYGSEAQASQARDHFRPLFIDRVLTEAEREAADAYFLAHAPDRSWLRRLAARVSSLFARLTDAPAPAPEGSD